MKDLIEALTIFAKYSNARKPSHCEHDVLYVLVDPDVVSVDDISQLMALGFIAVEDEHHFISYRFGNA